jgi:hypothetical protein
MRNFRKMAAICAMLLGAMPLVAAAQANHNTARSNKNTVAAPAEDAVPADASGEEQRAGKRGYDYYKAQSDTAAVIAGPVGSGQPTSEGSQVKRTVPKQTQGATFGERVNAGLNKSGNAGTPGPASSETKPQSLNDADKSILSVIR